MSSITRSEFRVWNVAQFISSYNASNYLYLGIAKPYQWDLLASLDIIPDLPSDNIAGQNRDWEDMMHLRLVNPSSISHGIYKELWAPNIKYDTYRHDWNAIRQSVYNGANTFYLTPKNLSEAKYVVVSSNYNIYICLKQNIIGGVVQPSVNTPESGIAVGVNTGMFKTADGYLWKFMGVTTSMDITRFMTDTYMPVKTLTIAPSTSDAYYPQWTNQVNSALFKRGVYVINVTSAGSNYNGGLPGDVALTDSSITITGNGSGLAGVIKYGPGGVVQSIDITNPGTGYTFLNISISGGTGLVIDPIFTSAWGLGADPAMDANGFYVIINTTLNDAEGGVFTISNSYRKIILVSNPLLYATNTKSTQATLDSTLTLTLSGGLLASYAPGQVVTDSVTGAKGRVVDWTSATGKLRVVRTPNEGAGTTGANSSFAVSSIVNPGPGVVTTVTTPSVEPGSGKIIYTEYRTPISRSVGQTENLVITLEF